MINPPSQTDTFSQALDIYDKQHPLLVDAAGALIISGGGSGANVNVLDFPAVQAISKSFSTRSDTYTGAAAGVLINASTMPRETFALQVKGISAVADAWDVVLEASLDGTNFTTVLEQARPSPFENGFLYT